MNRLALLLSLFLSAGIFGASAQSLLPAIQFNYANLAGQSISIDSATKKITFDVNSSGAGLQVISPNGFGLGGLLGAIEGEFTIGTVTSGPGPIETAPVSGSGVFRLFDSAMVALTADLTWSDSLTFGTLGVLNANAGINMTNFAYAGSNVDLQNLRDSSETGVSILTFQFIPPSGQPARSLTWLTTSGNGVNETSYSGSVVTNAPMVVVPEPTTYAALLAGVVLLAVCVGRRSRPVVA